MNTADDFEERGRDRRTPRLFDKTTNDSSNVGKRGHKSPRTWAKWYAKYGPPLVKFIGFRRSKWKDEAPDVVQEVAAMIAGDPYITDRGADDKYRTVLCRLCIKVIDGKHNAHRETAERRYAEHLLVAQQPTRNDRSEARRQLLDFIGIIRRNLMDGKYDVGRYFPDVNLNDLDLWREVQLHEGNVSATARDLGRDRRTIQGACDRVEREIALRAEERAKKLGYIE